MILPFDNDTRPVERKIAKRSLRAERMRNIFAVAAIIMTTVLFTALLTLGTGMAESIRRADMILSGGDGHARFIDLDTTEYERLRTHPLIEEIAYCRKLADHVDNEALSKRETIFWYYDETGMDDQFVNPTNGHTPVKENEIIADTKTLELTWLSNGERIDSRIYPKLQQMFDDMRAQQAGRRFPGGRSIQITGQIPEPYGHGTSRLRSMSKRRVCVWILPNTLMAAGCFQTDCFLLKEMIVNGIMST